MVDINLLPVIFDSAFQPDAVGPNNCRQVQYHEITDGGESCSGPH